MAIRDLFKKQEEHTETPKAPKRTSVKRAQKAEKTGGSPSADAIFAGVLLRAYFTEKTARASEQNAYAFRVRGTANKFEIKRAVEGKYGVTVKSVRTVNTNAKARRRGAITGWKPGFKKAIVAIKEGQKIEIE